MYVHADRGASRATKTSVRATNMKHVDTREHTDEPRQRTHRERGGERAESAGLLCSLSLSPSFFLPSMSLFLRSSLCSSRWVPRWLHVHLFFYITGWRECERRKPVRTSLHTPYVCNADASVYSRILCSSVPVFHPPSSPRSIYRFYLSIYRPLPVHMHAHRVLRSR